MKRLRRQANNPISADKLASAHGASTGMLLAGTNGPNPGANGSLILPTVGSESPTPLSEMVYFTVLRSGLSVALAHLNQVDTGASAV